MIKNNDNMGSILDLKAWIAFFGFYTVTFTNVDIFMKVFSFLLVCAFTLRRWWIMEKRNKDNEQL